MSVATFRAPDEVHGILQVVGDHNRTLQHFFGALNRAAQGPEADGPQAHLVLLDVHDTVRTHFHSVDQFQILYGVPGYKYQRRPIPEFFLHYVDAYVGYGPITTTDVRGEYFSIRAKHSRNPPIGYLPDDRDKVVRGGRRHLRVDLTHHLRAPLVPGKATVTSLFEPYDDRLAAFFVNIGPGCQGVQPPPVAGSAGQYLCVVGGEVEHDGHRYGPKSLAWRGTGDDAVLSTADQGCRLLVTQFAAPAPI